MTTRDKLLDIAARAYQLSRELEAIGAPVAQGGADDISFAASHQIGCSLGSLRYTSTKLTKLANDLQTNRP